MTTFGSAGEKISSGGDLKSLRGPSRQEKLADAFDRVELSDLVVKTDTDKEFMVDSLFLCAQSPVFDVMLEHDFKEKTERAITIKMAPDEQVEALLLFLYSAELTGSDTFAAELLPLAVQYEVAGLISLCVDAFIRSLTVANIFEKIETIEMFPQLEDLRKRTLAFVASNKLYIRKAHSQATMKEFFCKHAEVLFDMWESGW
ncbi:Speckle-type POZ protein A-like protein [Aphelenchoides fujianensis]|nr:Speckle-type POZ protein A-like protein [Aphelenchoides fujianensis]